MSSSHCLLHAELSALASSSWLTAMLDIASSSTRIHDPN